MGKKVKYRNMKIWDIRMILFLIVEEFKRWGLSNFLILNHIYFLFVFMCNIQCFTVVDLS